MAEQTTAQGDTGAGESAAGVDTTGQASAAGAQAAQTAAQAAQTDAGQQSAAPAEVVYGEFDMSQYAEGMGLDATLLDELTALTKAKGLPQEAVQELINFDARRTAAIREAAQQQVLEMAKAWEQQTRSDAEIGGDKLTATLADAAKARDMFAPEGFKELMDQTGLGNHPAMIKLLARIGKAVSEDKVLTGKEPQDRVSVASKLYPSMSKQ